MAKVKVIHTASVYELTLDQDEMDYLTTLVGNTIGMEHSGLFDAMEAAGGVCNDGVWFASTTIAMEHN